MKNSLFIFLLSFVSNVFGQTDSLERAFINKKIQNNEISQEEIKKLYSNNWKLTIKQFGKYPDLPLDENKEVHYSFVKTYDKPQNWLFSRTMEWLSIYYGFKPTDLYYNKEDGKIIYQNSISVDASKSCLMTVVITLKTNKMRIEFLNIGYQTYIPGYNSQMGWVPERTVYNQIRQLYPVIDKKDSEWSKTLSLFKWTNKTLNTDVMRLWDYIESFDKKNEF